MKIAINGFGRLGRCIARVILERKDVQIAAINDIANHENLAYLLKKDSMHGSLKQDIFLHNEYLIIQSSDSYQKIPFLGALDSNTLDFGTFGADVVIESSGKFLDSASVAHHLQ